MALQGDGKIVAAGVAAVGRRLRARPLQPERNARPELLRRRQADDRLRRASARTGWRSRATARSSRSAPPAAGRDFALARYNADGSLDTSFSDDGKRRPTSADFDAASAVALQGDGKIVAVGADCASATSRRPLQPGRLARHELLRRRQADDRLPGISTRQGTWRYRRTAGSSRSASPGAAPRHDFALARYNPDGSLDTSFSGDGKQTTSFGGSDSANGVALQGDGRIVAVGGRARRNDDFALARYNPDGTLDTSFSGDGKQTTDFGGLDSATGVALQGDGKIVAVGTGGVAAAWTSRSPATTRRHARHELLRRRQADDRLRRRRPGDRGGASGRRQDRRRRRAVVAPGRRRLRARPLQPQRLPRHELLRGRQAEDRLRGLRRRGDGVAVQSERQDRRRGPRRRAAGRLRARALPPNGSLDTSFSGDGKQTTLFVGSEEATGVALQGDGRIVVVGGDGDGDFALARYNSNGSLDTTFSGDGRQTTDFGIAEDRERGGAPRQRQDRRGRRRERRFFSSLRARALQPQWVARHELLRRRQAGGQLWGRQRGDGVALQGDGKIVAVGGGGGDRQRLRLARSTANGSLDASFSGDGRQTTGSGGSKGDRGGAPGRRQDRRGRAGPRPQSDLRFRDRSLSGGLSPARAEARRSRERFRR